LGGLESGKSGNLQVYYGEGKRGNKKAVGNLTFQKRKKKRGKEDVC